MFWLSFQADWYESVIMKFHPPTTKMSYVDWDFLKKLAPPIIEVVDSVFPKCQRKRLVKIMSFKRLE